ncbi:hypothetical protein [Dinoroseobacter sp. S124A]|uniref:hypothetical protein n=1 Tax=Dinoroseobacter sp. S124A TaxID=3415128 RepID=UPI003C7A40ED
MSEDEKEKASLDSIQTTPVNFPKENGSRATSELTQLTHEQETFKNELGWLGKPFGGRKEKPGNISGLVIVACFLLLLVAYLKPPSEGLGMTFEQMFLGLISVVTLILGYLFGSNDRS